MIYPIKLESTQDVVKLNNFAANEDYDLSVSSGNTNNREFSTMDYFPTTLAFVLYTLFCNTIGATDIVSTISAVTFVLG